MAKPVQKDNSTYDLKVSLRQRALLELGPDVEPVILETHGGMGKLFARCYSFVKAGVVFETDPEKIMTLVRQRPNWAVYEADCEKAIAAGAADHLAVNFVDLDPYGQPWGVVDAFWKSKRPRPDKIVMVVNDGLRQGLQMKGGWDIESVQPAVEKYGNRLHSIYLQVAQEMMKDKAAEAGYKLKRWTGYYCGAHSNMSHYCAVFEKA
jgi:hypothetical protein